MATFRSVEEMDVWRVARDLARDIYQVSGSGPFAKDFGLRDQIRRASVSIVSNISEGFERDGRGEFIQFLSTAKGSAGEVKAQLTIALDQGYLSAVSYMKCHHEAVRVSQMIGGFMNYLRRSKTTGLKYKPAPHEKRETRDEKRAVL